MSHTQVNPNFTFAHDAAVSPWNFADFQMGPAAVVISLLLQLVEIYLKIGQLDNTLAYMNAVTSMKASQLTGEFQKDQGQQQKKAQIMSGIGEIGNGAVSLAGTIGGETYAYKASHSVSVGEEYLKPINKSNETSTQITSNPVSRVEDQKIDLNNQNVKTRIQKMKTELDITKSPTEMKTEYEDTTASKKITISDADILQQIDNQDVEAIKKHAKKQIDKKMSEIQGNGEKIRLLTQGLQYLPQGAFTLAGANDQALAKDAEAKATIMQNLMSLFNSNNSTMQGKSDSEFNLISAIAQYLEQLLNANRFNGG